jgi:hypothetical protein
MGIVTSFCLGARFCIGACHLAAPPGAGADFGFKIEKSHLALLANGFGFQLQQVFGRGQPLHFQIARGDAMRPKALLTQVPEDERRACHGAIELEVHKISHTHARLTQDGLQIIEGQLHLGIQIRRDAAIRRDSHQPRRDESSRPRRMDESMGKTGGRGRKFTRIDDSRHAGSRWKKAT